MRLESSQRNRRELVGDQMRNDGHCNTTPSDGAKTRVVNFFLFGGLWKSPNLICEWLRHGFARCNGLIEGIGFVSVANFIKSY